LPQAGRLRSPELQARGIREACLHWRRARGLEKNSLPIRVAGREGGHENHSAFLAPRLLSPRALDRRARGPTRPPGPARGVEQFETLIRRSIVEPAPHGTRERILPEFCPDHDRSFLESASHARKLFPLSRCRGPRSLAGGIE